MGSSKEDIALAQSEYDKFLLEQSNGLKIAVKEAIKAYFAAYEAESQRANKTFEEKTGERWEAGFKTWHYHHGGALLHKCLTLHKSDACSKSRQEVSI